MNTQTSGLAKNLPAILLVLATALLLAFSWQFLQRRHEVALSERFDVETLRISHHINDRMNLYGQMLRGAAGLFAASKDVTRAEWKLYVEKLDLDQQSLGIQGVGFSLRVPPEHLAEHVAELRQQGFKDYAIKPAGQRDDYTSIIYLEPFNTRNQRAFGYDMFSEPVRRAAMELARDSGMIAFSGKVKLVQETNQDVQAGFLAYQPVYANNLIPQSVAQRRASLVGWTYSPFRVNDVMAPILRNDMSGPIRIEIFDGPAIATQNLLFDSAVNSAAATPTGDLVKFRSLELNGRTWTLRFSSLPEFAATSRLQPPWVEFSAAALIVLLLFLITWALINTRRRAESIATELTATLGKSEAEFRAYFELAGVGVAHLNAPEGRYIRVNERYRKFLGYNPGELEQMNFQAVTHPEDVQLGADQMHSLALGVINSFSLEKRYLRKDGQVVWGSLNVTGVFDALGKLDYSIAVLEDITDRIVAQTRLQQALSEQSAMLENELIGIVKVMNRTIIWANPAFEKMLGYNHGELIGKNTRQCYASDAAYQALGAAAYPILSAGNIYRAQIEHLRKDGESIWVDLSGTILNRDTGESLWGFLDITESKQAEAKLQLAANVFSHAREGIMITNTQGDILDVNATFSFITGYSRDEVIGRNPRVLNSGRHDQAFFDAMWRDLRKQGHWSGEVWNRRKNGEVFAVMQTVSAVQDSEGNTQQYVSLFSDITPLKEHEQQLEFIAHYDALTGLPNRVLLADRLQQAMVQTQRRNLQLAVTYLDLDGFKAINDNHGHDAGDQLLVTVASRMDQVLRDGDTLARLGGDEFVAILLDLPNIEASVPLLTRLLTAASQPVHVGDLEMQVSASIGVTFYPQSEEEGADQLLRQADQAMYQAKLAGKNRYHIFDTDQDRNVRGHRESLDRIQIGLNDGEFLLYYQPKVNMRSGRIVGAEALIRWQHPERGLLSPAAFLPVIEEHVLAVEVGEWVIDTALTQLEIWQAAGLHIPVSVNVGARQLQQTNFVARLSALLANHPQIKPSDLELEVLETSALEDIAQVSRVMHACREIGVSFALDDFGTGYSSLTYLKRLPAFQLKIDQSFVRDMLDDPEDLAILEGVLGLASAFRRQAIAEGVESIEHGVMLLQLGCELAQGYGIARPMPASELPAWCATWRTDPTWANVAAISHDDLPLLFAGVEHRAWIKSIKDYLSGDLAIPPSLDHKQCRFGAWLDAEALAQDGDLTFNLAIEPIHQRVHALAAELLQQHALNDAADTQSRFAELDALRDKLLAQLKLQVRQHRPKKMLNP